jgi:CRISPR/Cas system-associated exonuclease Cas4 (RecB family)
MKRKTQSGIISSQHNKEPAMHPLSKTKLLAFRQCPKRLWLEIHQPVKPIITAAMKARFDAGHQVGDIAQQLYDPKGKGQLIDFKQEGTAAALARSTKLLASSQPIFEAGFAAGGALAYADVLLPVRKGGKQFWRMIEVKSSTSIKDYHREDAAIQAFIAKHAGVPLASITLAHIDSHWTYPGDGDYQGLLIENDLSDEAFAREEEVKDWIAGAQKIARKRTEPAINTGQHCSTPYPCGFLEYCQSQEPQAEYPVHWLPGIQTKALKSLIEDDGVTDLRKVPDELLNNRQRRVKEHTLSGKVYFDAENAAANLAVHKRPAYFLDFETIQFAVPVWKGTRPYQNIPFQFSVQRLSRTGKVEPTAFLDLTGKDPSKACAESLIAACGERGPVFVYNAGFEKGRIKELAERFPRLKQSLLAINDRIVDLRPVAEQHYYHPSQQGSWSLKKVLPAVAPDLCYEALEGVQDGGMAMTAYLKAISAPKDQANKEDIKQQLINYCALDTYAMVRLWEVFSGQRKFIR